MRGLITAVLLSLSISAQAALIDRGGGFIYDDVLDVTWLQDANYARTVGYEVDGRFRFGWEDSVAWVDGLSIYDSIRDVTYDDWRLPTTLQPDPSCSGQAGFGSYGYDCTGSELGHLYNVDGGQLGLFTNLRTYNYWSGDRDGSDAWAVDFYDGGWQDTYQTWDNFFYTLPVRDGDVAASIVPIPAPILLFGSALAALWVRRTNTRRATDTPRP